MGKSIVISCHADGVSSPKIQWLANGQPLEEANPRYRLLNDGRQLEISASEVSDTGRYSCIAKNEAGITDRDFDLEVLGRNSKLEAHLESYKLACEVSGSILKF